LNIGFFIPFLTQFIKQKKSKKCNYIYTQLNIIKAHLLVSTPQPKLSLNWVGLGINPLILKLIKLPKLVCISQKKKNSLELF